MADQFSNVSLTEISAMLAAVGALGTAAYGLVDASKAFAGGMSNPGFGYIRAAISPLVFGAGGGATSFGKKEIIATLRANWLNGVSKADQKATAKSLVRLGMTAVNAPHLAAATGVDKDRLATAATKARAGQALDAQDMNVLGELDAIVSAIIDRGYERADQFYRNWAKIAAAFVAIALAVIAGGIDHTDGYWFSSRWWGAVLIGAISTPLAPIAKDLSSSLATAVKAVNAKR